jgi:hypothetical protein
LEARSEQCPPIAVPIAAASCRWFATRSASLVANRWMSPRSAPERRRSSKRSGPKWRKRRSKTFFS